MASRARGRNCPIIELLEQSGVAPSCHDHLRQDIEQWLAMHRVTLEGAALGGIDELLAYVDGTTPQKNAIRRLLQAYNEDIVQAARLRRRLQAEAHTEEAAEGGRGKSAMAEVEAADKATGAEVVEEKLSKSYAEAVPAALTEGIEAAAPEALSTFDNQEDAMEGGDDNAPSGGTVEATIHQDWGDATSGNERLSPGRHEGIISESDNDVANLRAPRGAATNIA